MIEKLTKWYAENDKTAKVIGVVLVLLLLWVTCSNAKADVTVGALYGSSNKADGASILTGQYNFKMLGQNVYAGAWAFMSEPSGDLHTSTTCVPGKCKKPPVCTTTKYRDDTDMDAAIYAGWQAFKAKGFDAGIGVIAFNEPDVMTEGRSTLHAMLNYTIPASPVVLSYQYAGGSWLGIGFNIPLGKSQTWTVERVK